MNVLITGGSGFAGRFISEYLIQRGYDVTATYRSNTPPNHNAKITFVKQELSEHIEIEGEFDAIIHTACSHSGPVLGIGDYVRDNIDSAREIVRFARNKRIRTIIYFSTRSVYGEVRQSEVDESADIINPDKYGITKQVAEKIFQEAAEINTIGFRTPGIIGPGAHDIWLVDIVNKIRNNADITVNDFNTKNLVYIGDIARFIDKLITASVNGEKFRYSIVNLGCEEEISNFEIAGIIKKRFLSGSNISKRAPQAGLFRMNIDRALEMGFESSSPQDIINFYLDSVI